MRRNLGCGHSRKLTTHAGAQAYVGVGARTRKRDCVVVVETRTWTRNAYTRRKGTAKQLATDATTIALSEGDL